MKTFNFCKRTISLILAVMMLVSVFTVGIVSTSAVETDVVDTAAEVDTAQTGVNITGGDVLYLKPNFNWKQDGARFAAYLCNGSSNAQWIDAFEWGNDYYAIVVPEGKSHKNIVWCRMNPATTSNNWDNKWDQTNDLTYDGTKNLYTVAEGAWSKGSGSWSQYSETTFTPGSKLYLKPDIWDADGVWYAAYFFNAGGNTWVKAAACPNDGGYYYVEVPATTGSAAKANTDSAWSRVIWTRMNPLYDKLAWDEDDIDRVHNQTKTLWADTGKTGDNDNNCFKITAWHEDNNDNNPSTGVWEYFTETELGEGSGKKTTVYFRDDTAKNAQDGKYWLHKHDAKFFVGTDVIDPKTGKRFIVEMKETVDTLSGHKMWTADIDTATTRVTFYRTSYFFDESNATEKPWNTWSGEFKIDTPVYCAEGSGAGRWDSASMVKVPGKTMKDYWFGLWVDSRGDGNVEQAIKAFRHDDKNWSLYLPSYVDISKLKVYTSFDSLSIEGGYYASGKNIIKGAPNTLYLQTGVTYTLNGKRTADGQNVEPITFKVYQTTDVASLFLNTKQELFADVTAGRDAADGLGKNDAWPSDSGITADNKKYVSEYKDGIETKGTIYLYDEAGDIVNGGENENTLKKIKGRGNSSFEASMKIYGKYAYNFNLDEKVELIDGATASKKWCLLANNVDHTMIRNTFVYALADDIGIKYAPETRLVDVYNNGNYFGAYVITEKVEYGKSTLMADMKNLDDGNEDANIEAYDNEDIMDDLEGHLIQDIATSELTTVDGVGYQYQYTKSDDPENWPYHQPDDYNTKYNFLLEFELFSRYEAEASWFVSPRTGQAVVVKYPEFATQDEMEWIIGEYEKAEAAIYEGEYEDIDAILDVESFAKMYLLQELAINLDAGATSYYIHNDQATDKLVSSPVWDYDWALGAYTGGKKYIYNESNTVDSEDMANPNQMFVKNKALKTDSDNEYTNAGKTYEDNYNFQAKLVQNAEVWEVCQNIYTNTFVSALNKYIDADTNDAEDTGIILTKYLPAFTSSVEMNHARWGSLTRTDDTWGTKITSDYVKGSYDFRVGEKLTSKKDGATSSNTYANTVYYLNDWLLKRRDYMSSSQAGYGNLYVKADRYKISDVSFEAVLDGDQLKLAPTVGTMTKGEEDSLRNLEASEVNYSIYVDGKLEATYTLAEVPANITLKPGTHTVYITVSPVDYDELVVKSTNTETYTVEATGAVVDQTIYFKSSESYRYIPSVTVGETTYAMEQTGSAIRYNDTYTQGYYWYKAVVPVTIGDAFELTFTNIVGMKAVVTVDSASYVANGYYFGADNLNNAKVAVDLTAESETVRNFVKSATNMVNNNPEAAGIATTSLDGTIYNLGDTDEDDVISILDVTAMQYDLAQLKSMSATGTALADYDLDGVVSIADATAIQVYLVNN